MIAIPGNVRVWLATGHTDMRRGFPSLARLVQESLKRDPHAGDLYVFRGRRGDLMPKNEMLRMLKEMGIDMPVVAAVDKLLSGRANVDQVLQELLARPPRPEVH